MGARQSVDERPRSNSVDVSSTGGGGETGGVGGGSNGSGVHTGLAPRGTSRSVLSAADFLNAMRLSGAGDDSGPEDGGGPGDEGGHAVAGPSRPPPYPREPYRWGRRSLLSSGGAGSSAGGAGLAGLPSSHRRGRLTHGHLSRRSMPLFMMDITCPICHKRVASDEADVHLVMCLTRPKITYNEDVLGETKGECAICLEDMEAGTTIARLPCLCIYHKDCIDDWFKRKNCCPEHPGDD